MSTIQVDGSVVSAGSRGPQGPPGAATPATTSALGAVIIGDNLTVDETGRVSAPAPGGSALPSQVSFAAAVDLTGNHFMPPQTVSAVIAFTPGSSPAAGASNYVRLTADGTNAPTFAGFAQWGGSLGYDNRNGIVNLIQFFFDGTQSFYSVTQMANASPTPTIPGAPTAVTATAGNAQASVAFVAPLNTGNSAILDYTVTASTGQTATGSATPIVVTGLTNGTAVTFTVHARNAIGAGPESAASTAVTPAAGGSSFRLTALSSDMTESGSPGAYQYAGTGLGFGSGIMFGGIGTLQRQAGVAGSITFKRAGSGSEIYVGLLAGATPVFMNQLSVALMSSFNHGFYTSMINGGEQTETNPSLGINDGDLMRLSWSADLATVTSAVSKDNGSTWTSLFVFTGVSASLTHVQISVATAPGVVSSFATTGMA